MVEKFSCKVVLVMQSGSHGGVVHMVVKHVTVHPFCDWNVSAGIITHALRKLTRKVYAIQGLGLCDGRVSSVRSVAIALSKQTAERVATSHSEPGMRLSNNKVASEKAILELVIKNKEK